MEYLFPFQVLLDPIDESNPMWQFVNLSFTYDQLYPDKVLGTYTRIKYKLKLTRRSSFFVANVIIPSILINYLSLATFVIPAEENTAFSVTIFLAQTVNLMTTYQFLPNGGIKIPIWAKYLCISIVNLAIIIILNVGLNRFKKFRSNGNSRYSSEIEASVRVGLVFESLVSCKNCGERITDTKVQNMDVFTEYQTQPKCSFFKTVKLNHLDVGLFSLAFLCLTAITVDTLARLIS